MKIFYFKCKMWSCFYKFWKSTILFIPHILNAIGAILKPIMIALIFIEVYFIINWF